MMTFLGCSTTSFALENDYDFRKAKWGMTKEEVKSGEYNVDWIDRYLNLIYFKDTINSKDGKEIHYTVNFYFYDGKLYKGEYNLREAAFDKNVIEMYNDIVESYKNKYRYDKIELYNESSACIFNYFYNKENTIIEVSYVPRDNIFKITFSDIATVNEIRKKEEEQRMLELKKKEEMIKRYKKEITTKF